MNDAGSTGNPGPYGPPPQGGPVPPGHSGGWTGSGQPPPAPGYGQPAQGPPPGWPATPPDPHGGQGPHAAGGGGDWRPPGPTPAGPNGTGAGSGGKRTAIIAGVAALGLLGACLCGGGAWLVIQSDGDDDGGGAGGGTSSSTEDLTPTAAAEASAEDFFAALVDGDSARAKELSGDLQASDALLTDEMLAASAKRAPISDVSANAVGEVTEGDYTADVEVTYTLGSETVSETYSSIRDTQTDTWKLALGAPRVSSLQDRYPGLDLRLNGIDVPDGDFALFPGSYALTTTTKYLTMTEGEFDVTEQYSVDIGSPLAEVSPMGEKAFRSAVSKAVDACVASRNLKAGCGLELPSSLSDGTKMRGGTIDRSLSSNARSTLRTLTATSDRTNPTLVTGERIGSVSTEGECTKAGQSGRCTVTFGPSLGRPSVDITDSTLTVEWD